MLSKIVLMIGLAVAAATAVATMSECQRSCEQNYKYCSTKRKASESACRTEYEKCRRGCAKKEGKPGPG